MTKALINNLIFLLFFSIFSSFANAGNGLSVDVNRTKIIEGESITLRVSIDNDKINETPDFSPLQKEFEILRKFKSSKISIFNTTKESFTEWNFTLRPLKKGKITIPSIEAGSIKSNPITIEVLDSNDDEAIQHRKRHAFIETEVDHLQPYVQSQVTMIAKLYHLPSLGGNATLTHPSVKDAIVVPMGDDKKSQTERNGYVYHVVERAYAIFPQKSGKLKIEGPVFEGAFFDQTEVSSRFDSFFQVEQSKPVRVHGKPITLDVKASPLLEGVKHWLPASKLHLLEKWQMPETLEVGKPITRTITLRAEGLSSEQLPEIELKKQSGVNLYRTKPTLDNVFERNFVMGRRVDTITYIPVTPGKVVFPEITVNWWNTKSNEVEKITLPEKIVEVIEEVNKEITKKIVTKDIPKNEPTKEEYGTNFWTMIAIIFAIMWLLTILVWFLTMKKKKSPKTPRKPKKIKKLSEKALIKNIEDACKENNPKDAEKYLLLWAKKKIDTKPKTLQAISDNVKEPLKTAIKNLEAVLYNDNKDNWNAEELLYALKNVVIKKSSDAKSDTDLPPLNP